MTERDIFIAALQEGDRARRQAYLDEVCAGRAELRRQVENLLRLHQGAGSFLEKPAPDVPATGVCQEGAEQPSSWEGPGTMIGLYKLIEQIGEGGMGSVWMAQQQEPVKRLVALKLIKAGMDSKQVSARFEAERQALALMDHVNIARVLEAGAVGVPPSGGLAMAEDRLKAEPQQGRPYFVMELVRGVPITRYCDEHHLTPRQRLELFIPVCQAIQHAHQKGIIHRDLKPSNVLVALYDGKPVPKVIDFGIAKATGQQLTDKTLVTGFGAIVGTLEYMSPEQAELHNHDIDTRSDIYSLGVLLYELLTGTTPFSRKEVGKGGMLEMLRVIREQEPTRPSTKLSTAEGLPALAANRGTEPAKLTKLVRGELDWIVMKALEKDRSRRYETANGFALDVQRYLNDEPVLACPPSMGYRLRKFAQRNRGLMVAASAVLLALVVGIVGTTAGLVEAWRQRDLTELAREDAVANEKKAKAEAGKAQEARNQAQQLAAEEKAARDRAEWLLYASQINLAKQAWESHNALLTYHYLKSCRPDFRGWEHNYLTALSTSNQRAFRGHTKAINSMVLSTDGKRIVSGSDDGTVKVWDMATGQAGLTLTGHTGPVQSVALSADGKRIASGGRDHTVKVWDAATGKVILTLTGHRNAVVGVTFSPDGKRIFSGSRDKTVRVWDAATGQETLLLRGHAHGVTSLALSSDGKRIASGSHDQTVKVWNAVTGEEVLTLKGHTEAVTSVALSSDGQRIVSGSHDGMVKVWDATTGQVILTLAGHVTAVTSAVFTPDGKRIVSSSHDQAVKVRDAVAVQEARIIKGPNSNLALSGDGKRLVSGSRDNTVKVWDTATGEEVLTLRGHTHVVNGTAISPDGKRIASGAYDHTVKVWDAATGRALLTLRGHTKGAGCVAFSPDGKRIVSGSLDKTAKVWDAATGEVVLTFTEHKEAVYDVACSPDGKRIASASQDWTVKVWDAATGQVICTLKGHTNSVSSVAFSPDGKRIVSGSHDGTVKVWDAARGRAILTLTGHTRQVSCAALSPDGKRIVSGSKDDTVKVWDTTTGYETLTLKGDSDIECVTFSPDGKCIFCGSFGGRVKVWDASMSPQRP